MTPPESPTLQQRLVTFILAFNASLLLLDTLKPTKAVQRGMAAAIATSDEIKKRFQTTNETEQKAMVIASRGKLKEVRDLILREPFNIQMMKARKEWVETSRQLLKDTEGI